MTFGYLEVSQHGSPRSHLLYMSLSCSTTINMNEHAVNLHVQCTQADGTCAHIIFMYSQQCVMLYQALPLLIIGKLNFKH